jgi:hypothetical protein
MECFIDPLTWPELKPHLKLQFSNLDEEDLEFSGGQEEELLERISRKSGRDKEELTEIIKQIEVNLKKRNLE